jgi:hypothetical protein
VNQRWVLEGLLALGTLVVVWRRWGPGAQTNVTYRREQDAYSVTDRPSRRIASTSCGTSSRAASCTQKISVQRDGSWTPITGFSLPHLLPT